jgi:UDP-N-acetylmuramate dehydrogenase
MIGIENPTIKDVSDAVINIRKRKLPDPLEIGNSGSFFKNPVVSLEIKNKILEQYPEVPVYPKMENAFKLAAGWLIEQCGWKGKRIENYGVHVKQALVLVNYGGAKGQDIYNLSEDIIQSVKQKFGITLEREVNII